MDEKDFPSNSKETPPAREPKKVERVTINAAQRRKKPFGKRMAETFVQGEAKTAWQFVLYDVMVPAAKDMVADAFSQGIERMLFGEVRSRSRRSGGIGPGNSVNYTRYSTGPIGARQADPRPRLSTRARAAHDFDEIVLSTRPEAEEVIDRLFDLLNKYDVVSVSDLYELVGVEGTYIDDKWGWTALPGAGVQRITQGYLLDLPRPEQLK